MSQQNEKELSRKTQTNDKYKRILQKDAIILSTSGMFEIIHLKKKLSPNLVWGAISKSQTKSSAKSDTNYKVFRDERAQCGLN